MRHGKKGRQLSRTASHREALLRNMATSLFRHGRINTTTAKAKELRPFAERLITIAKRGDLHARRLAGRKIQDREILVKPRATPGSLAFPQEMNRCPIPSGCHMAKPGSTSKVLACSRSAAGL